MADLQKMVSIVGPPKALISLNMNSENQVKMYRKKKEMDETAEFNEEDNENLAKAAQSFIEF